MAEGTPCGIEPGAVQTAREVLAQLIAAGLRELVLSPGSRSAPLAYAAAEAEAAGLLRIHVRIDERSAGFLALGLAQSTARPVAVVVTSGTAVGELLPAVMEANHTGTELLVLSADRPEELQGTGASQTTDQRELYAPHVRASLNVAAGQDPAPMLRQALAALAGNSHRAAGPVQLNLQFRDPLVPEPGSSLKDRPWTRKLAGGQWNPSAAQPVSWNGSSPLATRRTVVLAGHGAGAEAQAFARELDLPLFAEPSSGARFSDQLISHYRLLLAAARQRIERVVLFGRPTLSRPVAALLADPSVPSALWQPSPPAWYRQGRRREQVIDNAGQLRDFAGRGPRGWLGAWQELDAQARHVAGELQPAADFTGYHLAQALWRHRQGPLFIGSSNIVRDFDLAARGGSGPGPGVYANRGLAGIDGSISTALGIAAGSGQPTRAVLGDITFLHDAGALLLAPDEPLPALDVVVYNDAGGSIFSTLEHGAVQESGTYAGAVERLFATPHRAEIDRLAAAYGWDYQRPSSRGGLEALLAQPQPQSPRIIEVRAPREQLRRHGLELAAKVSQLPWPAG